jgi:two-component system CitB family response regulator
MGPIRRVLVVEDNAQIMNAYLRSLRQLRNVQPLAATNIATARVVLDTYNLHLAVIDRYLPDGDGIELLAEARVQDTRVRLLLVSGRNDTSSTVKAMSVGANDVIDKPVGLGVLERYVNAIGAPSAESWPTLDSAMWQHVQRVYKDSQLNKSMTARRLGVDRNTLKRWLRRPPPPASRS